MVFGLVIDVRYADSVQIDLMRATFVELPPFERARKDYLDDEAYRLLQCELMENPTAGAVIEGTGGLRKLRQTDPRRGKGKRGGLRVIYYWFLGVDQFWLFTVYDKDQADDLTPAQRKLLKQLLRVELENRQLKDGEHHDH
jgi:mRNA-degrading endonuclease RelE of RelBE toxin-antitoxin system